MKKWGFTLVEILICIGIIAVIAAILFPVLSQAREKSRAATCVSNMHQVWTSIQLYVSDHDGSYPNRFAYSDWNNTSSPHNPRITETLPSCPNMKPIDFVRYGKRGVPGYALNGELATYFECSDDAPRRPTRESEITQPAGTVGLGERDASESLQGGPDPFEESSVRPPDLEKGWLRHQGGANYVFVDGHIHWHTKEQVGSDSDRKRGMRPPTFAVYPPDKCDTP
jgi:prepilin-type processing-associated H-X9-DG protein/prepilin-type N-terminal cleavage/methylation domain-containing protein